MPRLLAIMSSLLLVGALFVWAGHANDTNTTHDQASARATLNANMARAEWGTRVVLRGTVAHAGRQPNVILQKRSQGRWKNTAKRTVLAGGSYQFTVKPTIGKHRHRVVITSKGRKISLSRPVTITVTPRLRPEGRIAGEQTKVSGKLPVTAGRRVNLQRKTARGWRKIATARAQRGGKVSFTVKVSAMRLRFAARATAKQRRFTSPAVRLAPRHQTVNLTAPTSLAAGSTGRAQARAHPIRPGRPLRLQVKESRGWTTLSQARQDKHGRATFDLTFAKPGIRHLRVRAMGHNGAPGATSPTARVDVRQDPRVLCLKQNDIPRSQCNALADMAAANPDSPRLTQHWARNSQPCSWPGVRCEQGHVVALDLSSFALTALPDSVGDLVGLEELLVQGNQIRSLPASLGQLKNLYLLDASANRLTAVPSFAPKLPSLAWLSLADNNVAGDISAWARDMNTRRLLTILRLAGNGCLTIKDTTIAAWLTTKDSQWNESCEQLTTQ